MRVRATRRLTSGAITLLILFMTIIAAPMIGPERAYACSCAMEMDMETAMSRYEAVFAGEVTKIDQGNTNKIVQSSADSVEVTLHVQQVWKGSLSEQTKVLTLRSEASCGYTFKDNLSYVVFASEDESGKLHTALCNGNMPLTSADEPVKQLDAITPSYKPDAVDAPKAEAEAGPSDTGTETVIDEDGSLWANYWPAAVGVLVVLAGLAVCFVRRNRRG